MTQHQLNMLFGEAALKLLLWKALHKYNLYCI